jgi:transposase
MSQPLCVGIDVSQSQLDVAVRPGARFSVSNDETGRATVAAQLRRLAPVLIVLEATGGLEVPLTGVLAAECERVKVFAVEANEQKLRPTRRSIGENALTKWLTRPSRGRPKDYALRPPLMSNVRAHTWLHG